MALFNNDKQQAAQQQAAPQQATEEKVNAATSAANDFLNDFAGQGLEGLEGSALSAQYLGIVQPDSSAAEAGHEVATWVNMAANENYGSSVEVIVVGVTMAWIERESQAPFSTVGKYPIGGIEVNTIPVPAGKRGFPKMINPASGNEVQELPVYAVLLANNPESGVKYFSPTRGSMRACKMWNTMLRSQRLPNGAIAPVFAFSWKLDVDLIKKGDNGGKVLRDYAQFTRATRGSIIAKSLFEASVQPALSDSSKLLQLAAPESSGDTDND